MPLPRARQLVRIKWRRPSATTAPHQSTWLPGRLRALRARRHAREHCLGRSAALEGAAQSASERAQEDDGLSPLDTDRQELLLSCDRWPEAKFHEEWADQMPQGVTPDAGYPNPNPTSNPDSDHRALNLTLTLTLTLTI